MNRRKLVVLVASIVAASDFGMVTPPAARADAVAAYQMQGMPYRAFSELPSRELRITGGVLEIAFAPGGHDLTDSELLSWIRDSGEAVALYYGKFPVPRLQILVLPVSGAGVRTGTSYGYGGAAIKVSVGENSTSSNLRQDWVMTHEMVHLALPGMRGSQHWLEEGIATYVEPIARAQAGQMSAEQVWAGMVKGLPNGLPRDGDRGLDQTPTWGRTYWGGALFCLLADIEIRVRTGNARGLQDALRAVNRAGGTIEASWPITRVLQIGDEATGVPVLSELYERMRNAPVEVQLEDLWQRLGITVGADGIRFNDDAPLAAIRRAITQNPANASVPG